MRSEVKKKKSAQWKLKLKSVNTIGGSEELADRDYDYQVSSKVIKE